jgi:hypothetical protein
VVRWSSGAALPVAGERRFVPIFPFEGARVQPVQRAHDFANDVGCHLGAFDDLQENTYLAVFMPPSPPDDPLSPSAIKPCLPSRS